MERNLENNGYVRPTPISESIIVFLRKSILSGKFAPGQKLNEREIAERLGVSRSPIREALRVMAKEGLVTIVPHKGTVVSEISERELVEIFEMREMIELYAVDLIERHSVTDYEEMEKSLELDIEKLNKLSIDQYLSEVTRFHKALVETSGNKILSQFYTVLCNSLKRYQLLAATIPSRMEISIKEHRDILQEITRRNFTAARKLLQTHMEDLKSRILKEIDLSGHH